MPSTCSHHFEVQWMSQSQQFCTRNHFRSGYYRLSNLNGRCSSTPSMRIHLWSLVKNDKAVCPVIHLWTPTIQLTTRTCTTRERLHGIYRWNTHPPNIEQCFGAPNFSSNRFPDAARANVRPIWPLHLFLYTSPVKNIFNVFKKKVDSKSTLCAICMF